MGGCVMAMILLTTPLVSMRGSFQGNVYGKSPSGQYMRAKRRRISGSSQSQRLVRKAFSRTKDFWLRVSPAVSVQQSWSAFATYPETAYQAFIRINWYSFFNNTKPHILPPSD